MNHVYYLLWLSDSIIMESAFFPTYEEALVYLNHRYREEVYPNPEYSEDKLFAERLSNAEATLYDIIMDSSGYGGPECYILIEEYKPSPAHLACWLNAVTNPHEVLEHISRLQERAAEVEA